MGQHSKKNRAEPDAENDSSTSAALSESKRMLETLISNLRGMVYRCRNDSHWTMEFVSDGCYDLTGYRQQELVLNGHVSYEQLTHPDDRARLREQITAEVAAGRRFCVEYRIIHADGSIRWVTEMGVGLGAGREHLIEGFIQDISERKAAETALQEAERRYRGIFENATEGIFQTTADGRYIHVNPALARIYGYDTAHELIASLHDIGARLYVHPGRREEFMQLVRERGVVRSFISQVYNRRGEIIWIAENARAVYDADGRFTHYEGTVVDVSDTRHYEDQLKHQANHDALTQLPNRALLMDRLAHAIAHAQRHGALVAVAFIDLDRFKLVNDSFGHETGDLLLKSMAQRMSACLRQTDTVARQGGDEFVLIVTGESDQLEIIAVLDRIRNAIAEPWRSGPQQLHVTCSIGASLFPRDAHEAETLLRNADMAMYQAKAAGRNVTRFFTADLVSATLHRMDIEQSLRRALEQREFELHYQPRYDLRTNQLCGMEALLRWRRGGAELVQPDRFISIAEETGLIVPLGEWVLWEACSFNRSLQRITAFTAATVSVNLSVRQLHHPEFAAHLMRVLADTRLDPQGLELEITESLMMQDVEHCMAVLKSLEEVGVQVAIDDFGTGYSSLSYLKRLTVDRLKIDRSFVRDITSDSDDAAIVRAVIAMGRSLGIRVLAEGVETEEQTAFLRANGCDEVQGYHFGKPMPGDEFLALIGERSRSDQPFIR